MQTVDNLEREIATPLYRKLLDILRQMIDEGEYDVNDKLPSEHELMRQFGLSRMTVRRALGVLESENRIYRVQGKGTFVAPSVDIDGRISCAGVRKFLGSEESVVTTRVVEAVIIPSCDQISERLNIKPGENVVRIARLKSDIDGPLSLQISHVPEHLAPSLLQWDWGSEKLCSVLEGNFGLVADRVEENLGVRHPSRWECHQLSRSVKESLLVIEQTNYSRDGMAFEYTEILLLATRTRLLYQLQNLENTAGGSNLEFTLEELPGRGLCPVS